MLLFERIFNLIGAQLRSVESPFHIKKHPVLKLFIRGTKYDPVTGLLTSEHEWMSNALASNQVNEGMNLNPLGQLRSNVASMYFGDYVSFHHTDLENDSGQNAVPFLDIQEVVPTPVAPLIGAGIYFKNTGSSGGYVGLYSVPNDLWHFNKRLDKKAFDNLIKSHADAYKNVS